MTEEHFTSLNKPHRSEENESSGANVIVHHWKKEKKSQFHLIL